MDEPNVTVTLTMREARALADAAMRLDASIIARTAGGIQPSERRRQARLKLVAAIKEADASSREDRS